MTVLEWIKANAREGANIAEAEEMLASSKMPETKEEAWNFIQKTPAFKSAMDAEVSRATAKHDENFMVNKFPEILKAERNKLMKELNPEETPERKELREIREELAKEKAEKAFELRRNALIKKATEKGFDPELAAELAVFGEDAETKLDVFVEKFSKNVNNKYEQTVKEKMGNSAPVGSAGNIGAITKEALATPEGRKALLEQAKATGGMVTVQE